MFPNAQHSAIAQSLLAEAANSASFQNAVFWVYSALGAFAVACLLGGYLVAHVIDRAPRKSRSSLNPTWPSRRSSP